MINSLAGLKSEIKKNQQFEIFDNKSGHWCQVDISVNEAGSFWLGIQLSGANLRIKQVKS